MPLPYEKLDVITYSWQKVLGGEGAHGIIILSPRAIERLESYTQSWPLPKIFRLTKSGKLIEGIFKGATINTPSMLANEDYLAALNWVESIGGLKELFRRSNANLTAIEEFVAEHEWIHFLAESKDICSNTSVCLTIDLHNESLKELLNILERENVALDCGAYRDAPPGLRIWCGATVETDDVKALCSWLEWAYKQVS